MRLRRALLVTLLLGACAGAEFRLDPSPSCSFRTERAEVPDAGSRQQIRAQPSLGQRHGCVRYDGDDVLCWGDNALGQISSRADPQPGEGWEFDGWRGGPDVVLPMVAAGGAHTCVVAREDVYCWGNNDAGQLGDATTEPVSGLYEVLPAADATVVASGLLHTCVGTPEGVLCWGDNSRGQLGHPELDCCHEPTWVEGIEPPVLQVAAGAYHTCVQLGAALGAVETLCWGDDTYGALGDGEPGGVQPEPVAVDLAMGGGGTPVLAPRVLVAGAHHTCVIADGDIYCWGRGRSGELGTGRAEDSAVPVPVSAPFTPIAVSAGGSVALSHDDSGMLVGGEGTGHTCARSTDLRIWCWGANDHGQLGVLSPPGAEVLSPLPVAGDMAWNHVGAGGTFTCGTTTDGELWCWGANDSGQIGRAGPGSPVPVPTTVVP